MPENMSAAYSEIAAKYESGTGGATLKIADACVSCAPSITSESVIHDDACGPAIVTQAIMARGVAPTIYATDLSKGMVDVAQEIVKSKGWTMVHCQEMDGQSLSFQDNTFTHSFSCLGVFLFPDSGKGVAEMFRTLRPGGWACISSMKDPVWPGIAQKVYAAQFPGGAPSLQFPETPGWYEEADIRNTLSRAGFDRVDVCEVPASFRYPSKAAGRSVWQGQLRMFSAVLRALDNDAFERLLEQFWEEMVNEHGSSHPDGSVEFTIRAWVASGTKPR